MKLGPVTIQLARPQVATGETGYSGGPSWNGSRTFGAETDYNTVWSTLSTRWTTVQKMLTDSDISAALDAVVLPLLAAGLTVEPGEDTPDGREQAAFLQNDLDNMSLSLSDTRTAALYGALSDGVAVFEKVWQPGDDKKIHLRKLGERPPRTVAADGWLQDEHGGPAGIKQLNGLGEPITLDIDRLLLFIHRRRQGSIIGESLLRRVYGSWLMKTELMKVGSAAVARHAMGIPTMRPASQAQAYLDTVDVLLEGLSAHEHSFVRLAPDQAMTDFEVKGVQGTMADPVPQLEYHRRGIYLGLLCPFLPLGSDGVGSLALSETQSGFFLMLLQSLARMEEDTYNRYLIPQWCSYNWPSVKEGALPRVAVGRLDRRDVAAWFAAVVQAVQSGAVLVGDELKRQAEDMLGLEPDEAKPVTDPTVAAVAVSSESSFSGVQITSALQLLDLFKMGSLTRAQVETSLAAFLNMTPDVIAGFLGDSAPAKPATTTPDTRQDSGEDVGDPTPAKDTVTVQSAAGDKRPSLIAIEALGIDVRFADTAKRLDEREARVIGKLRKLQDKQARRLIAIAKAAVAKGDGSVLEQTVVATDEEAAVLYDEMVAEYADASADYAHELESQGADPIMLAAPKLPLPKPKRLDLLRLFSVEIARSLGDRMRTAWGGEVARQLRPEVGLNVVNLTNLITTAGDRLLADVAGQSIGAALGAARSDMAAANEALIDHEIYSTMLDDNVCEECDKYEGMEFPVGEGPHAPNSYCLGGTDRCRCERVPVIRR